MITKALEYLRANFLAASVPVENHGCKYSPVTLNIIKAPQADTLKLHTLQGIVDYVSAETTECKGGITHILSPENVRLVTPITADYRQRETLLESTLVQNSFPFGNYVTQEDFIVGLQSMFVDTPLRAELLKVAGSLTAEQIQISEDDGVTQRGTAKVGIARQATVDLPNPVNLRPFRTFTEVDQPESLFVFRMKLAGVPMLALFEADGGAWRNQAIKDIAFWLTGALKDKGIAIIA
jgi:hypothetical protein